MSTADGPEIAWFDAVEAWPGALPAAFALSSGAVGDGREALGGLVARALGAELGEVAIAHREGLPPHIVQPVDTGLCLSLARRGPFAAVALASSPVGVDVETVDGGEVPWNVLHAQEVAYLRGLAPADVPPAFARLWSLKEAYVKALGQGFARHPGSFRVLFDGPGRAAVVDPEEGPAVVHTSTTWREADGQRAAFSCVVLQPR